MYFHELTAMSAKVAADALYNGELGNEVRLLVNNYATMQLEDFKMKMDNEKEVLMEKIKSFCSHKTYHHREHECTPECKERGKYLSLQKN